MGLVDPGAEEGYAWVGGVEELWVVGEEVEGVYCASAVGC